MIVAEVDWSPQLLKCFCNAFGGKIVWVIVTVDSMAWREDSDCDYDCSLTDNCDMMEDMEEWRMDDMEGRSSELCRGALIMITVIVIVSYCPPCRGASIKRATPCVVLLASLLLILDI